MPAIRPYVYTHVLEKTDSQHVVQSLNRHWDDILERRYVDLQSEKALSLDVACDQANRIVDFILTFEGLPRLQSDWSRAVNVASSASDLNTLFRGFENFLRATPLPNPPLAGRPKAQTATGRLE